MFKSSVILALIGSLSFFPAIKTTETGENSATSPSYNILPIINIEQGAKFTPPNDILKSVPVEDGLSFSAGTIFTAGKSKSQLFFCPSATTERQSEITKALDTSTKYSELQEGRDLEYSKYCLFETPFKGADTLSCSEEPTPVLQKITQIRDGKKSDKPCGPGDSGKLYEFFYLTCPKLGLFRTMNMHGGTKGQDFLKFLLESPFIAVKNTVYELCYDHEKKKAIYTKNQFNINNLLFRDDMKFEREYQYSMLTDKYEYFDVDFEHIKNTYKIADEPNPSNPSQYKSQKLVSPKHMSFALFKKPTFHSLNIEPMQKDLIDLWNLIDEVIMDNFKNEPVSLDIYTGTFPALKSEYKVQHLLDSDIEIPETWVKILYLEDKRYGNKGMVITMKNYISSSYMDCLTNLCYSPLLQNIIGKKFPRAIYQICCQPVTNEHLRLFNIELTTDFHISIKNLTYGD